MVSVGNLHWGGTGKTPLVAALAGLLRDAGWRVAILSRGYRGRAREPLVVSRGDGPLAPPGEAGDEPVELAARLPGVAVVVGRDRHAAGLLATAALTPPPTLFLLDDGFSHVALGRDLDLLVLPADDPFGGGRLLPSGRLREPLASARHAAAIVVTGAGASRELAAAVARGLAGHGFTGEAFAAPAENGPARDASGDLLPAGAPVFLVAGIARPGRLLAAAAAAGLEVRGRLLLSDHHIYTRRDARRIERRLAEVGARWALTTGKDLVKLRSMLSCPLAELPVAARPEAALGEWLVARLRPRG